MKTPRLALLTATLLTACFYFSCQKTETPAGPEPGPGHITEYTQANISGRITDDQKLPVSGAVVRVGTSNTTTDVNGMFSLNNVQVDKTAGLVQVEKEGFFKGIKTLVVTSGKDNQVAIQLIRKVVAGTFNGSSGGTITIPAAGGSIIFGPNSILNTANLAGYTGPVSVSAFFIDPAADNFFDIMPGALRGIDANNNETGLRSFGMMAVELTGANGEKLQLAGGKKATLHFPIPASLQGEAPATIPLWSLHDSTGLWKEEGAATKQGTEYVGTVSHFSFWNCDAPYPVVDFTATIKTQQGTALTATRVIITNPNGSSNISGSGYTDNDGIVKGLIPANQALVLKVMDKCGNLVHNQNIGPFSTTADMGVVKVTINNTVVTINGTVGTCSFTPVTSGYVTISMDSSYYRASIVNGAFSMAITRCKSISSTASITVYDITNNQSGTSTIPVSGPTINTGLLNACGTLPDEYMYYTVGDSTYGYTSPLDIVSVSKAMVHNEPTAIVILGKPADMFARGQTYFHMRDNPSIGSHPILYLSCGIPNVQTWLLKEPTNVNITEFGNSGQGYISGSFTANVHDTTKVKSNVIHLSFRVKR
jgi:hypothetical protein